MSLAPRAPDRSPPTGRDDLTAARWERWAIGVTVLLGLSLLAASEPGSVNDATNLRTVERLYHRGTFQLDPPGDDPVANMLYWDDVMRVDGAYYSVRPPTLAFIAVAPYALIEGLAGAVGSHDRLFRLVTGLLASAAAGAWLVVWRRRAAGRAPQARLGVAVVLLAGVGAVVLAPARTEAYPLLVVATSGILTAAAVTMVIREAQAAGVGVTGRLAVAGGLGVGSMVTVYSTVVNHHTTAGALLTLAVCGLLRWRRERRVGWTTALGIGLGLGLAPTIDLAGGGIFLLCLGPLAVLRPGGGAVALGVASAGALHAILNVQITGDVVPGLVRPELFDFPESRQTAERLSGLWKWSSMEERAVYLARVLGGGRGLLLYTPLVVPALAGAWRLGRATPYVREIGAVGVASVAHVLYVTEFTSNLSGICYGIRWFVLAVPLWWLLLVLGWPTLSRGERLATVALGLYSGYVAWWGLGQGAWQPYPAPVASIPGQRMLFAAVIAMGAVMAVRSWRSPAPSVRAAGRGPRPSPGG